MCKRVINVALSRLQYITYIVGTHIGRVQKKNARISMCFLNENNEMS